MPVEFDLYSDADATPQVKARIRLKSDGHWEQVVRDGQRDQSFPKTGFWGKSDGHGGTSAGTLLIGPEGVRGSIVILNGFYPAQDRKIGNGYFQTVEGWKYTGKVRFHILAGEQVTPKNYQQRLYEAYGIAWQKGKGKIPEQVLAMFADPTNLGAMAAFGASYLVRNPSLWFRIFRTVAGKVLSYVLLLQYAYRMDKFYGMVESATTQEEIEAAGLYLSDVLAQACADLGIALVLKMLEFMAGKRKAPEYDDPDVIEVPHTSGVIEIRTWRSVYKDLIAERNRLLKASNAAADPKESVALRERAFNVSCQASYLKAFILETCHHMEVMRAAQVHVNAVCKKVQTLAGGANASGAIQAYLIKLTQSAGIALTADEAASLTGAMQAAIKEGRGKLPELVWNMHDIETAFTSKLSAGISWGMKNPFKPPQGWTIEQLEMAAKGKHPDGRPMTSADFDTMFPNQRRKLLEIYGSEKAVYGAAAEMKGSISGHGEVAHHSPKTFADFMEMACDVAHALIQKRSYRPSANDLAEITKIINTELPGSKRPWVKLGFACLQMLEQDYLVNPKRVKASTLVEYGQSALAQEMGLIR